MWIKYENCILVAALCDQRIRAPLKEREFSTSSIVLVHYTGLVMLMSDGLFARLAYVHDELLFPELFTQLIPWTMNVHRLIKIEVLVVVVQVILWTMHIEHHVAKDIWISWTRVNYCFVLESLKIVTHQLDRNVSRRIKCRNSKSKLTISSWLDPFSLTFWKNRFLYPMRRSEVLIGFARRIVCFIQSLSTFVIRLYWNSGLFH